MLSSVVHRSVPPCGNDVDGEPGGRAPPLEATEPKAQVLPLRSPTAASSDIGGGAPLGASGQNREWPPSRHIGWRHVSQCAWCGLFAEDPDLAAEVHDGHRVRGIGARMLRSLARRRLERRGQPTPSARSLSRHLQKHVDRHEVDGLDLNAYAAGSESRSASFEVQELEEAWTLYARLRRRFEQLDSALSMTSRDGEIDAHRLAQLAGLANALRGMLDLVTKGRGASDLTIAAVQRAVGLALQTFSSSLVEELCSLADHAERNGAVEVAGRFRAIAAPGGPIANAVAHAAQVAFDDTLARLRIRRPPKAAAGDAR